LATAYGIAVTGTMLITTILTFFVIRYGWRYPLWLSISATGFFLALDSLLLVSCSVKFMQGGWFPVFIGGVMLLLMWTWKQGREVLLERIKQDDPPLQGFVALMADSKLTRIARTAVFLVSDPHSAPQALMHNLKHNQVLHQTNLVLTVEYAETPTVAADARLDYQSLGHGFWQMTLRYGFMEMPDIPKALQECRLPGVEIDPFTTSYFVSREVIVPNAGGKMAKWRDSLFSAMSRNAGSVVEYFNIPVNSVIELGSRVHI
jgi:KUP system potassium uptake protein